MAVNLGIISIDDLELAQQYGLIISYEYDDFGFFNLEGNSYFDIRYNTMSPIFCLRNTTAMPPDIFIQALCFLTISSTALALPIFNPGIPCNCSSPTNYYNCSSFDLLAGYIIYDVNLLSSDISVTLKYSVELLSNAVLSHSSYAAFNDAAFTIFSATSKVALRVANEYLYTQEFLIESFINLCYLPDHDGAVCSIVLFQSLDFVSRQVSAYHYPLKEGSCADSFTVPHDTW